MSKAPSIAGAPTLPYLCVGWSFWIKMPLPAAGTVVPLLRVARPHRAQLSRDELPVLLPDRPPRVRPTARRQRPRARRRRYACPASPRLEYWQRLQLRACTPCRLSQRHRRFSRVRRLRHRLAGPVLRRRPPPPRLPCPQLRPCRRPEAPALPQLPQLPHPLRIGLPWTPWTRQ